MTETANFIEGRVLSLAYEGTRFPEIASEALTYLYLAKAWTKRHDMSCLEKKVMAAIQRIETAHVPA